MPVSAFNSSSFFGLSFTHTFLQTVVDTRSISDNNRRSVVSFSFANSFQSLSLISTHSDLCAIYITVSRSDQTEIFLAYTFTGSSKFSNRTYWSRFRSLTTRIRINFCIQYEDIYILTGCKNMVEPTETDIIRSSVTTDNPLRFLDEIFAQRSDLLTNFTLIGCSFYHRCDLSFQFDRTFGIFLIGDPFGKQSLHFFGTTAFDSLIHQLNDTFTHFVNSKIHTETEFTEIFEQRIRPCRTVTFFVCRIRSRRDRT